MTDIRSQSLAALEQSYKQQLQVLTSRRQELLKQVEACEREMARFDQKLRYIQALVSGPEAAVAVPSSLPRPAPRAIPGGKKRRTRRSPVREATLQVLRNRPGQKLSVKQIRTAIRKDTNKRCSRQAINNGVERLEKDGLIRRGRAPKGTGAQFVFWAV